MFQKKSRIWGAYAAMLALFVVLTLLIPSEPTRVFYTAFGGTAALFIIAAADAARKIRRMQESGMQLRWPDMFTMLVIQLIFFVFLDMGSVFCPFYIAVVAEVIVYAATAVIVFGEERLREAVRWLYRHRKAALSCLLAVIIAIPVVYFGMPFVKYQWAAMKLDKGEFARAAEIFGGLGDFRDASDQRAESLYRLGVQLNEAGKHEQAYFTLQDITGREDVQAYIDGDEELSAVREKYGAYGVDNVVDFGTWNGKPLRWGVLAQEGSRRLLFAMEPVAYKAFNDVFDITYWHNASLRTWLNGEFLTTAFSGDEQAKILETAVKNDDNAMYRTEAGDDTVDRVFLLSIDEAELYRMGRKDWFTSSTSNMWLRSPGCSRIDAATVSMGGGVDEMGTNIDWDNVAVRPVMWIDILDLAE